MNPSQSTPPLASPFSFLAIVSGRLTTASDDPVKDGRDLAEQCLMELQSLDDREHFPPALFILLLSPAYLDKIATDALLSSVQSRLLESEHASIPMIGSSVGGVIFDNKVYERGALLLCVASRQWAVKVGVGQNARRESGLSAASDVCRQLFEDPDDTRDFNPLGNRWLLAFLPGYLSQGAADTYLVPEILDHLLEQLKRRFPVVGGVSSGGPRANDREPMQFANWRIYTGALVCARIDSGTPLATSLAHGFKDTGQLVVVRELSEDGRRIVRLADEADSPAKVLRRYGPHVLLGAFTADDRMVHIVPFEGPIENASEIRLHRKIRRKIPLAVLVPDKNELLRALQKAAKQSMWRAQVEKPIGAFLIGCTGLYSHTDIDLPAALKKIAALTESHRCFGGLFDGEIGLDEAAKSVPTNWSLVSVVFGDELRERALIQGGFKALADFEPRLLETMVTDSTKPFSNRDEETPLLETLGRWCTEIIFQAGYPGAMLSLQFRNNFPNDWIVAIAATGARFARILKDTRREFPGGDLLARVIDEAKPKYSPSLKEEKSADQPSVEKSKLISHYVIPLWAGRPDDGRPNAVLQIDLGDRRHREDLSIQEKKLLHTIAEEIEWALKSFSSYHELRIARHLDQALAVCMACPTVDTGVEKYLNLALDTVGATQGHVRMIDRKGMLVLRAGRGSYYEMAKQSRLSLATGAASWACLSFRENRLILVNQATQELKARHPGTDEPAPKELVEALTEVNSFAAVPFNGPNDRKIGVISLSSDQSFFFTMSRTNSLTDLGARLAMLVEHLEQKEEQAKEQRDHKFRHEIATEVPKVLNEQTAQEFLNHIVTDYRRAFNADIASLYLWDSEIAALVLRAESGWSTPDWVHAVRFTEGVGWPGIVMLTNENRYEEDYSAVLSAVANSPTRREYLQYMVGGSLSAETHIRCIGLPLWLGSERLGVLTLYTRTNFSTVEKSDLIEAQRRLLGLLNLARSQLVEQRERQERENREKAALLLLSPPKGTYQELVDWLHNTYRLESAILLEIADNLPGRKVQWWRTTTSLGGQALSEDSNTLLLADPLLSETTRTWQLQKRHRTLTLEQRKIPSELATEGLVERVCIPLVFGDSPPIGVVEMRWDVTSAGYAHRLIPRITDEHLNLLGRIAFSALCRHRAEVEVEKSKREAEQTQRAVTAMAALTVQSGHRLGNILRNIKSILYVFGDKIHSNISSAFHTEVNAGEAQLNRITREAHSIIHPRAQRIELSAFLDNVFARRIGHYPDAAKWRAFNSVDASIVIWMDPDHLDQCIDNLIDNAIRAMPDGGSLRLWLEAQNFPATIQLVIEDTGKGMAPEAIRSALAGFYTSGSGSGIGVLIARLLLQANGGELKIKSTENVGTSVYVTLPTSQPKELPCMQES